MSRTPLLELKRVTRSFGGQAVLRDVTIRVWPGETLVIIGESGCGKSVTTKLMAAFLEPTEGTVCWNSRPVQDRTAEELRRDRLRLGYLFQGAALFDSLSVFENVAFGLRENLRMTEAEIRDQVVRHLRVGGWSESVCEKSAAELSGGMRKRVALARALAMSPDIMVYDEPTTGLDPVMSDVINELILQTRLKRPVTSVVVTHDMHTVQRVADRGVMLYPLARLQPGQSQVVFEGTAKEAFDSNDPRIADFLRGRAGNRMQETAA